MVIAMMFRELERAALKGLDMPKNLWQFEQLCFLSLRCLYREFKSGVITKNQARAEKQDIIKAYEIGELHHRVDMQTQQMWHDLSEYLRMINFDGCEQCRTAAKIIDGRIKNYFKNGFIACGCIEANITKP